MSNARFKCIVVLILLGVTCFYTRVYYEPVRQFFASKEFAQKIANFPRQIGDWQYKGDISMTEEGYKALNPRALVFREYVNSQGKSIILTIVYHENERWGAHNVEVCYTSQGWSLIKKNGLSTQKVQLKEPDMTVNKMEVENRQIRKTVVYWWFTQGNQRVSNRLQQMLNNVYSSLFHGYCVSGLVRISAKGGKTATGALDNFIEQLMPVLEPYMP